MPLAIRGVPALVGALAIGCAGAVAQQQPGPTPAILDLVLSDRSVIRLGETFVGSGYTIGPQLFVDFTEDSPLQPMFFEPPAVSDSLISAEVLVNAKDTVVGINQQYANWVGVDGLRAALYHQLGAAKADAARSSLGKDCTEWLGPTYDALLCAADLPTDGPLLHEWVRRPAHQ